MRKPQRHDASSLQACTLAAAYVSVGYIEGTDLMHVVQAGGQHNETYWAQRFPGAMQFLLGPRD